MSAAKIQPAKCKATQTPDDSVNVRFVLNDADAREVFVAGSFNDWHPGATPLSCIGHGCWVKELFLPVGRYEYQFVVDGPLEAGPDGEKNRCQSVRRFELGDGRKKNKNGRPSNSVTIPKT